jgi:CxxC motif-containing protein (DUF1111 family)
VSRPAIAAATRPAGRAASRVAVLGALGLAAALAPAARAGGPEGDRLDGDRLGGDRLAAAIGERLFRRAWVPAPASTGADDGLGPLFNARACISCHAGLARGSTRTDRALDHGLVVRLGDGAGRPDPALGAQVQTAAIAGVAVEATVSLARRPAGDGLTRLVATVRPTRGTLADTTRISLRTAPALTLAGAIAAVDERSILAAEAASATGRAARLSDGGLGRFGWKAAEATLAGFTERAFSFDLGLSTPGRPAAGGDCTARQTDCLTAPGGSAAGGGREITAPIVAAIATHLARQPRPAPAGLDAAGRRGAAVFAAIGCAACHRPTLAGRDGGPVALYSDLLLHDLGPGLDDGVGDDVEAGGARSAEWRTAPLVGLGRARDRGLLHDGRAATIDEAIRWHGGAAAAARSGYLRLRPADARALAAFLEHL